MKVIRSRYAGACYGVERALALVNEVAGEVTDVEVADTREVAETAIDEATSAGARVADAGNGGAPGQPVQPAPPMQPMQPARTMQPAPPVQPARTMQPTPPARPVQPARTMQPTPPARPAQPVHTLGPLIHNPQVVSELRARGVEQTDTVEQVETGVLVIRSHGVAPAVIEQARLKGLRVVDATCPHVSKAHEAARQLREQGCLVMVVGERGHPEVEGIRAHAGDDAIVVQEPSDLPETLGSDNVGIVVQTTQEPGALDTIIDALQKRGVTPIVRNTICFATRQRQKAAIELAALVDVMLVIGGRNSGNTTRLAKLCAAICPQTHHIESATELDAAWFTGAETIGITAGASTPENQIIAVEQALGQLL